MLKATETILIKQTMPQLQLIADLPGHSDPAWSVSFNPTRSLLASCSTDKTVRLYSYTLPQSATTITHSTESTSSSFNEVFPNFEDPKPSFSLSTTIQTSHKRTVRSVAWAPSGRTLATASFDSTVGVWEEADPDDSGEGDEDIGMTEGIDRSGKMEEIDEDDEMDGIEKVNREWECVTTLEGHDSECKGVGFSNDGGLLASCSRDKSVWIWEGESLSSRFSKTPRHQFELKAVCCSTA